MLDDYGQRNLEYYTSVCLNGHAREDNILFKKV